MMSVILHGGPFNGRSIVLSPEIEDVYLSVEGFEGIELAPQPLKLDEVPTAHYRISNKEFAMSMPRPRFPVAAGWFIGMKNRPYSLTKGLQ